MSELQRLRIDLDRPVSGWLKVELSSGDPHYSFYPSHVPYDSISELVDALLKILDGDDKAIVRWNDEPVEHEFVFEPKGDQVDFRVYLINRAVIAKDREQVFLFNDAIQYVVEQFWKALRTIESRQSHEEYEKQWGEPFPVREMTELTKRVKELKEKAV